MCGHELARRELKIFTPGADGRLGFDFGRRYGKTDAGPAFFASESGLASTGKLVAVMLVKIGGKAAVDEAGDAASKSGAGWAHLACTRGIGFQLMFRWRIGYATLGCYDLHEQSQLC